MAEPAITRTILAGIAAQLATISVANGYHTEAGADVRLEESQSPCTAPFVSVFSASLVRGDDSRVTAEREFTVIVEGQLPVTLSNARELIDLMTDDVERCLDGFRSPAAALPMQFLESITLDRPDGLPVMALQAMFSTRFRR
jgi:hypothetical protein